MKPSEVDRVLARLEQIKQDTHNLFSWAHKATLTISENRFRYQYSSRNVMRQARDGSLKSFGVIDCHPAAESDKQVDTRFDSVLESLEPGLSTATEVFVELDEVVTSLKSLRKTSDVDESGNKVSTLRPKKKRVTK